MDFLTYIKLGAGAIVLAVLYYLYYNYTSMQDEISIFKEEQKLLKESIESKENELNQIRNDLSFIRSSITEIENKRIENDTKVEVLKESFEREKKNKKSFNELAINKPVLIENIVNKATSKKFICIEKTSGMKGEKYEKAICN